jgi:hypothetical protein
MVNSMDWVRVGALNVDARLLEQRPVARCRIEECRAACCGHGVHVDLADASRIVEAADMIKPHLPPGFDDVNNWFDGEVQTDSDFPTGYRVGTQVVEDLTHPAGTRCVFLRPDSRCALQVAGIANGRHPWDLKPFYCALYPLILLGNELQLDDDNEIYRLGGTCQRAAPKPVPLLDTFREELVLGLGQEGYNQLLAIASADGNQKTVGPHPSTENT